MTTVGFGDITPQTPAGRLVASMMMLMGWGVLAVPTGIVTAEMTSQRLRPISGGACPKCGVREHSADARFCRACGASLDDSAL
jgi:voltage-gated potassium channel